MKLSEFDNCMECLTWNGPALISAKNELELSMRVSSVRLMVEYHPLSNMGWKQTIDGIS